MSIDGKSEKNRKITELTVYSLSSAVIFVASFFLFKLQTVCGKDLVLHIDSALDGKGYSLTSVFLCFSYKIGAESGCAVFLSLVFVLTFFAGAYFFKVCTEQSELKFSYFKCWLISAPLNIISALYIPGLHEYFYCDPDFTNALQHTGFTQPLHNSTYLTMRLFAYLTLAVYLKIRHKYLSEGISVKEWLSFFVLLGLTNASKPNFFLFFAPAMLCELIYDLCKNGLGILKREILFGLPVLMTVPILLLQSNTVYSDTDSAEPSGIEVTARYFLESLSIKGILSGVIAVFASVLTVSIVCLVKKAVSRNFVFAWVMFAFAYIERWFIFETGPRALHGNFGWGLTLAGLILTVVCVERMLYLKDRVKKPTYFAMFLLIAASVIAGVIYFIGVLTTGGTLV